MSDMSQVLLTLSMAEIFMVTEELDVSEEEQCILHGLLEKRIKIYVSALMERAIKLGWSVWFCLTYWKIAYFPRCSFIQGQII